ncbi:MAG: DOMON-like domain-containing protein [Nitrospiraceae bacterium]|nr:DOMON-like domain-containing protein [Nitrospiraceae bacterium]
MDRRNFTLVPFQANEKKAPDVAITGSVQREGDLFSIGYEITGSLSGIEIPGPDVPSRRYALWEETCLEFFLGPGNSPRYWEFNLSPSGRWNVFSFESYRKGMREEPSFEKLPFISQTGPDALRLHLELELGVIFPPVPEKKIDVAVSAVLKMKNGSISYWALAHPAGQPDFHDRACFKIFLHSEKPKV